MVDDRLYMTGQRARPMEGSRATYAKRRRRNLVTLVGAGAACVIGAVIGFSAPRWLAEKPEGTPAPTLGAPAPVADQARRITEPYREPDRARVLAAHAEVERLYETDGLVGLARASELCFARLSREPSWALMDYCLALDALAGSKAAASRSDAGDVVAYFREGAVRRQQAVDALVPRVTDSYPRMLATNSLIQGVASAQGAAIAPLPAPAPRQEFAIDELRMALATPAPAPAPTPEPAPEPRPAPPPPPPAPVPAPAPPPVRLAEAPPPPRPVRLAEAPPPRPAAAPRAEPEPPARVEPSRPPARLASVAPTPAPRPAGAISRPAFDCLNASNPTQRMICSDGQLAAADRRLEAAFRRSLQISRTPDRLVREQNRWMNERDRLGPNPNAVLRHYERRIDELWLGD